MSNLRVDGLDVEVVGGLVEKEHVRPRERQVAERDARLLPAAQVTHRDLVGVPLHARINIRRRRRV